MGVKSLIGGREIISLGGGAPAQARNPQRQYERLTTIGGVTITNSNGAGALSGFTAISSPTSDLCGIEVTFENASSAAGRGMFHLRANGVVVVPNYYMKSNTADLCQAVIPIKIAANATLEIAIRTSSNTHTRIVSVRGIKANSTDAPGYSSMTAINVDTGNTLPGNVNVAGNDTWVPIIPTGLTAGYDAFMPTIGTLNALTGQMGTLSLGVGNSPSSAFYEKDFRANASEPYIPQAHFPIVHQALTLGDIISAKLTMVTSSDAANSRVGLYGFNI